jgi:hypothetical protein
MFEETWEKPYQVAAKDVEHDSGKHRPDTRNE